MTIDGERSDLGLALSGGGFRATLFHLGVMRSLYEHSLLSRIQVITAVSGGSIIAAHVVCNWDRYTGSEQAFQEAAEELIGLCRVDLRGKIVRRWLLGTALILPRLFKRLTFNRLLMNAYDRFFRRAELSALSAHPKAPEVHLLATSLTTGYLSKFTKDGFVLFDKSGNDRRITVSTIRLSIAVAASSAFPPLFPPIPITRQLLNTDSHELETTQYLSDGGLYDNLGLQELTRLALKSGRALNDMLIVSDGGGNFDWAIGKRYSFLISRTVRATDILMDRVSKLVPHLSVGERCRLCHIYIGKELYSENPGIRCLTPEMQRSVRNIRTDLDAFSELEISSLIHHGYSIANVQLASSNLITSPLSSDSKEQQHTWKYLGEQRATGKQFEIEDAKRRRWKLFSPRDPASWLLVLVLLTWLALVSSPGIYLTVQAYMTRRNLAAMARYNFCTVEVKVVGDDGMPVVDASIELESKATNPEYARSGNNGLASLPMIRHIFVPVEMTVTKEGYETEIGNIMINPNADKNQTVVRLHKLQ
jgi:predicted acylesterase/phospholipase RssA